MVGYIVISMIGVTVLLGWLMVAWLEKRDRRSKSRVYDLKCELCGQQLDYRQSGAGHLYVTPCPCCCPRTRAVKLPADWDSFFNEWRAAEY